MFVRFHSYLPMLVAFAILNLALPTQPQANNFLAPSPNTLALWHLDQNSETNILDSGPYNLTGTIQKGASRISAPWKRAVSFDGQTGSISIADQQGRLSLAGPFTIEAWVRLDSLTGMARPLISRAALTGGSAFELRYMTYPAGWAFKVQDPTGVRLVLYGRYNPSPKEWHHVAVTWNGHTTARLYVNGKELTNMAIYAMKAADLNQPWCLGTGEGGGKLQGAVDEVHFANCDLPPNAFRTGQVQYGFGKPGTNGIVPTIHQSGGPPASGKKYMTVHLAKGYPNMGGLLFVSPQFGSIPLPGGWFFVSPFNMATITVQLDGGLAGIPGTAKGQINLPSLSSAVLGSYLCFQALLVDPQLTTGFSLTSAMALWFPH